MRATSSSRSSSTTADRLARLADDLLALSREEAAAPPDETVRLDELARDAGRGGRGRAGAGDGAGRPGGARAGAREPGRERPPSRPRPGRDRGEQRRRGRAAHRRGRRTGGDRRRGRAGLRALLARARARPRLGPRARDRAGDRRAPRRPRLRRTALGSRSSSPLSEISQSLGLQRQPTERKDRRELLAQTLHPQPDRPCRRRVRRRDRRCGDRRRRRRRAVRRRRRSRSTRRSTTRSARSPPEGVTARVTFTNNLFPSGALLGQTGSALMSGASGRLWLTADGRGRIELQSDAGDVQIVWDDQTISVYDASSNTVYRADLPAGSTSAASGTDGAARARGHRQLPDRARRALGRLGRAADQRRAASPPTASRSRRSTTAACSARVELAWDAVARRPAARRRSTRRAASSPVLELAVTDISYGAVSASRRRRRAAGGREGRRPRHAARSRAAAPAARRRSPGSPRSRRPRRFPVVAPDTLVGLPRQDVRLVGGDDRARRSTARGSAGSCWSSARPTRRAHRPAAMLSGLPTVSLDGLTAHELATQLGTVLEWQRAARASCSPARCRRPRPRPRRGR